MFCIKNIHGIMCVCVCVCVCTHQIIESFGEKKTDAAADSAEIQQLRAMVKEKEREADRIAVIFADHVHVNGD